MKEKNDKYRVAVPRDFEPLIPGFMGNRQKELQALKLAAQEGDFAQLQRIGHRMKGLGGSYGFEEMTRLGKRIEDCARTRNSACAGICFDEYADYLAKVRIEFV